MKFEEQEKMYNMKMSKLIEQDGKCAVCGKLFKFCDKMELAHVLPQRGWIKDKYGIEVVHHELNMKVTHSGYCNSAVQISPNKTELVKAHIATIQAAIDEEINEMLPQRR